MEISVDSTNTHNTSTKQTVLNSTHIYIFIKHLSTHSDTDAKRRTNKTRQRHKHKRISETSTIMFNLIKVRKMKRQIKMAALLAGAAMASTATCVAQDKVEASVGADLVSSYEWRGQELGNMSVQPSLSIAYKGFSLGAWGSVGLDKEDTKEFDLTLGWSTGGFSVSVTDYWFAPYGENTNYFHYKAHETAHVFEAQVGYDFGPVAVNWYTNFAGDDGLNKDGDRAYSSYISLAAPFKLGGLDWTAEVGATPWATSFYADANGFAVCNVGLSASKEIKVTESFSIPAFAKISFNPASESTNFIFGLSF